MWCTKLSQNLNRWSILLYRSTWRAITEMWRRRQKFTNLVCLSSLVSLFFTSVTFSSSSKSLFLHFIYPSTLTVCTHDLWNNPNLSFSQSVHATYETMTDLNGFSIEFYCSDSPCTRHTKPWQLKWLLNRILSFSQSIHMMYEIMTDYRQCGAR